MLSTILSFLGSAFIGKFVDGAIGLFDKYLQKQITIEELKAQTLGLMIGAAKDVEVTHAQELTKTYATFMGAAEKSTALKSMLVFVCLSQTLVLLWHQVGIPALVYTTGHSYPSSGSTVEWSYALVAACLGFGPMVLRAGPSNYLDKIKAFLGR